MLHALTHGFAQHALGLRTAAGECGCDENKDEFHCCPRIADSIPGPRSPKAPVYAAIARGSSLNNSVDNTPTQGAILSCKSAAR